MTQEILEEPLEAPSNWRGADLATTTDWIHVLDDAETRDLEAALELARQTGKPLLDLRREDFPLPVLGRSVARWMAELEHGRGFLNVRGLPVDGRTDDEAAIMLFGLGLHMGTPISQNSAGDLLGHVRDTGANPDDPTVRLYKTRAELGFHSDGADIVALMCLRQGRSGGATRLVSTRALYTSGVCSTLWTTSNDVRQTPRS